MKRIIICCDGTWNRADQRSAGDATPTNVVRAAYLIAKAAAASPQIICYDEGVGNGNSLDRISGGAFGSGLNDHIFEAYRFLVANYQTGDELYFFGFSRGAFTARSIVGMIRKCGVLRRTSVEQYHAALALYRNDEHPDDAAPTAFRAAHSVAGTGTIPIKFIGVWDTVGALGIPLRGLRELTRRDYQFHDTELSGTVENAFHALAIDEHRAPFEPTLWSYKPKPSQTVKQVWFTGVHSDVGGGFAERGLSDVALRWMLDNAHAAGLNLDADALGAHPIDPDPLGRLHSNSVFSHLPLLGMNRTIGLARPSAPGAQPALDPTQSVHHAVLERWDSDVGYRPGQLRAHFKRTGDARADA